MSINKTVTEFYSKPLTDGYLDAYDRDHGPRFDALVKHFNLKGLMERKRVLDVGGGLGFLGKRLSSSVDYWVIDGANIPIEKRLCGGNWLERDLDCDSLPFVDEFDAAFCLETLEHLGNPHHCLVEIKKSVRVNGDIFISIPTEIVWHNTPYPSLLWPRQNFEIFLGQMALPIIEFWLWDQGWPAYHYRCRNAGWEEKRMVFSKKEEKFKFATPLEMTNL